MKNKKRAISKTASAITADTTTKKHPLEGAGLHYKDENGYVQHQAVIVTVISSGNTTIGDLALIQYFEWVSGGPSTRRLISLSEMASTDQWVFYSSVEEMKDHYERVDRYEKGDIPEAPSQ
jgi:hypothetical protein